MNGPLPWDDLPDTAQATVCHLVRVLAGGYTGRLLLDCNEGGVSNVSHERTSGRGTDGSRTIEVRSFHPRELDRAS